MKYVEGVTEYIDEEDLAKLRRYLKKENIYLVESSECKIDSNDDYFNRNSKLELNRGDQVSAAFLGDCIYMPNSFYELETSELWLLLYLDDNKRLKKLECISDKGIFDLLNQHMGDDENEIEY